MMCHSQVRAFRVAFIVAVLLALYAIFHFLPEYTRSFSHHGIRDYSLRHGLEADVVNPWVKVGPETEVYIYSAYLVEEYSKKLLAFGIESREGQPALYCLLSDGRGHTSCNENPATKRKLFVGHCHTDYCEYLYICAFSRSALTPEYVSFSPNQSCLQPSPWIPVIQNLQNRSNKISFGVCYSPLYQADDAQFIIESIEMKRILGAELITVYIHHASRKVWNVLKQYSKEGVVDVMNSTLPVLDSQVYYHAQMLFIQECGYRNMFRIKYLFFGDFDEVVVPQKHQNWHQMMADLDQESIGGFIFKHVQLQKDSTSDKTSHSLCNSSGWFKTIPRICSFTQRSPVFSKGRTKYFVKPKTFRKLECHSPGQLRPGFFTYLVPPEIAILYHYRLPPLHVRTELLTNDTIMIKYIPELIARIQHVFSLSMIIHPEP